ncbi:MAG: septum formation initiator family protein [Patescibacteria group bacterium]
MQSRPVLILLGILILIFVWNILGFWSKMEETSKNKKIVEDKVVALKQQKENYSSEINSLKTDQGKEKVFRENLGLAKEGEEMIVVVEDKNPPVAPKTAPSSGFLSFFRNLFK